MVITIAYSTLQITVSNHHLPNEVLVLLNKLGLLPNIFCNSQIKT